MNLKKKLIFVAMLLLCGGAGAHEIESLMGGADSVAAPEITKEAILSHDMGELGKLSVTGYIQVQWQMAEAEGVSAFSQGGSFPDNADNRFAVRRGRIKLKYDIGIVSLVFQPDFSEKSVKIRDVYIKVQSPNKFIGGQFGAYDRPFGYEISYSSSKRETPERSMIFNSLFPGERDLGAMVIMNHGGFALNAGLFDGTGVASEIDSYKDFIGRLTYSTELNGADLSAGFSYYNGTVVNPTQAYYEYQDAVGFVAQSSEQYSGYRREYYGVGATFLKDWAIGKTNLRAEYLWGQQPGTRQYNRSLIGGYDLTVTDDPLYLRNFLGGYILLAQDIADTKHTVVLKYDYYDPNTKIAGDKIGMLANTGAADIAYSTFGVGYNYRWNDNLKLTLYYDMISNETSQYLLGYEGRIKQNVFTVRLQAKF